MKFFSICIPTWEVKGMGVEYLEHSFNILAQQTFTDFDIVISDNSQDDNIKNLCNDWSSLLDVKYFQNENGRGFIAPNLNYALRQCTGKYIKILFQDDFLYNIDSLEMIYNGIQLTPGSKWILTGCVHTIDAETMFQPMIPRYHDKIYLGQNTISCPTVMTIKNDDDMLLFDESLLWLVDVEYYKRCHDKFGAPLIIESIGAVNREQPNRVTNSMTQEIINKETTRLENQYGK